MWTEKIKRAQGLPWQEIDGQALVLQPGRSQAHELNGTALWFWKHFDGTQSLDALLTEFCKEYDCTTETARQDVEKLVGQMNSIDLIEFV